MIKATRSMIIIFAGCLLIGCGANKVDDAKVSDAPEATVEAPANTDTDQAETVAEEEIDNSLIANYNIFVVESDNLNNGKWDDVISYTNKGENRSPQLSWEPVEGATSYAIYMVDTSMEYWIHWKVADIHETNLPEGYSSKTEYVGPYPPEGGTHTYEVYVIALKNPVDRLKGGLNGQNKKFTTFIDALDTDVDGNTGNIAGAAHISGTFTY